MEAPMPYFRVLWEEQISCSEVLCNLKIEPEHVDSSFPEQKKKNTKTLSSQPEVKALNLMLYSER